MNFVVIFFFFFFKQKTAYEIYQCDWSSDVCSSDLAVIKKDTLYVYYGAADEKLSVAKIKIEKLLEELKKNITKEFQY